MMENFYSVNKNTKEHIRNAYVKGVEWYTVECDKNGWVVWKSNEDICPLPEAHPNQVKFRNGNISCIDKTPENWMWDDVGDEEDIVAYKPLLIDGVVAQAMKDIDADVGDFSNVEQVVYRMIKAGYSK